MELCGYDGSPDSQTGGPAPGDHVPEVRLLLFLGQQLVHLRQLFYLYLDHALPAVSYRDSETKAREYTFESFSPLITRLAFR